MKFMLHQLGCIVGEDSRVDYGVVCCVSFLFMIGKGDIEVWAAISECLTWRICP